MALAPSSPRVVMRSSVVGGVVGGVERLLHPAEPLPRELAAQAEQLRREKMPLEYAREVGMPLAIEPLHPMQAADRACVNTMEQALDGAQTAPDRVDELRARRVARLHA